MKVLLTGATGQLGRALCAGRPTGIEVLAPPHDALDVTDPDAVAAAVAQARPDWIINAAAYTAVDRAESERRAAFALNAEAPAHLARAAAGCGARLLQVSTDFVFSGEQPRPYRPADPVAPVNVYGESKAAGESAVQSLLPGRHLIVRTAWLYSNREPNFVHTMLRLMRERDEIGVVDDQVGTPTSAGNLGVALWRAIERDLAGVHHWTDGGVASWYDFACAICTLAGDAGLLARRPQVVPVPTSAFPRPARRPAYSVLDKAATREALGAVPQHWREALVAAIGAWHGR